MHLDVAVDQEVTFELIRCGAWEPLVGRLVVFDVVGQQKHRRRFGFHDEGFGRADAAHVDGMPGELPALAMRVVVVPDLTEVEVEHIPPDPLAGVREDGRGVADERAAVEAVGGDPGADVRGDGVGSQRVDIGPVDLSARSDRCARRVEPHVEA